MSVSDSNKAHVLGESATRVLDACATVLGWGTPGSPVDGGGGRWSPIMVRRSHICIVALRECAPPTSTPDRCLQVRRGQEDSSEALFQLR